MARNYMCQGRFTIDIIASLPIDIILLIANRDSKAFRFIKLVKLTRLFRLGRIISYMRTKKSITFTLRILQTILFLFLAIHWLN